MEQEIYQVCQNCKGDGEFKFDTCQDCKGSGRTLFGFLVGKEEKAPVKASSTSHDKKEAVADAMSASASALKDAAEAKKKA